METWGIGGMDPITLAHTLRNFDVLKSAETHLKKV